MNEEEKERIKQKNLASTKETIKNIIKVILIYIISMIIFPMIVYIFFNKYIYGVKVPGVLGFTTFESDIIYAGNYKTIIYTIFVIFDIIFSFIIAKKFLKSWEYRMAISLMVLSSFIVKLMLGIILALILAFFNINPTTPSNNERQFYKEQSDGTYVKIDNCHDSSCVYKLTTSEILIEAAERGKTEVEYYSWGIYIGIIVASFCDKKKIKN